MANQTLIIVNGDYVSGELLPYLHNALMRWSLSQSELERLYDWIVAEALSKALENHVLGHIPVLNHQTNDLYRIIYGEVADVAQRAVQWLIKTNHLEFLSGHRLKVMTTYQDIVIVKSTTPY